MAQRGRPRKTPAQQQGNDELFKQETEPKKSARLQLIEEFAEALPGSKIFTQNDTLRFEINTGKALYTICIPMIEILELKIIRIDLGDGALTIKLI